MPEGASFNGYMDADLVIIPVVTPIDLDIAEDAVIFQLCYETAGETPDYWEYVWDKAKLVVSYYDLPIPERLRYKFLRMPLGYDPKKFYQDPNVPKVYDAIVTGFVDGGTGEVLSDVWRAGGHIAHVGENLRLGAGYNHFVNISDKKLCELYQQSKYVVALRYVEGFELPVIEGYACGCRPIIFDLPCYTHWFGDFSHKIDPEGDIVSQLRDVKNSTESFADIGVSHYSWENVMRPFWRRIKW
jgi:hypothetical protein